MTRTNPISYLIRLMARAWIAIRRRPVVGDLVSVDGFTGEIESMGLMTTSLNTSVSMVDIGVERLLGAQNHSRAGLQRGRLNIASTLPKEAVKKVAVTAMIRAKTPTPIFERCARSPDGDRVHVYVWAQRDQLDATLDAIREALWIELEPAEQITLDLPEHC